MNKYLYENKHEIKINNKIIGRDKIIMAGPCAITDRESIIKLSIELKNLGVDVIRGGAFKPRTSPYSFQGLEVLGLEYLIEAKKITGLPIISEITSTQYLQTYIDNVDIIQVGSRNMYNYELLKALGKTQKIILLKRGMNATYEEWLLAAEYILKEGNPNVILCERGIRTFETKTRNTLDLQAIPYVKKNSKLNIIVDPSHASGLNYMIKPMSLAALSAGADGLIIEVDYQNNCICDKKQNIDLDELKDILINIV